MSDILKKLSAPFSSSIVLWRVGATTPDKTKGMALAYIDSRDVQDRLNEVCGHEWQVRHPWSTADGKIACEIGVKIDGEWIWRGDGAGNTDVEAEKGAFSDAFKRAAVRWGIGRYLYDISSPWVELEQKGRSYVIAEREMNRLRSVLMSKAPPTSAAAATADKQASLPRRRFRDAISAAPSYTPSSTGDDQRPLKLSEIHLAIATALDTADSPSRIDGILRNHAHDLERIRKKHPPTYDDVMRLAAERRGQVVEQPRPTGRPFHASGSAPELMGEP